MSDVLLAEIDAAPPAPAVEGPQWSEILKAAGGFLALGACAGLGSGDAATALRTVPSSLAVGVGALVLTGPALVVGHQYLRLRARPADLVAVLSRGFVRAGRLSLGLAAPMLFFAATTALWGPMFVLMVGGVGAIGFGWTARWLRETESVAGGFRPSMELLVAAWSGLTVLVALRLAWDMARLVAG